MNTLKCNSAGASNFRADLPTINFIRFCFGIMRYLEKRLKNSICCNRALTGQMHAQEGTLAHVIWQKWVRQYVW